MKAAIGQVREEYAFSERRACAVMLVAAGTYRYRPRRSDEPLRTRLVALAREKPRFGYRRLHVLLSRSGERVNHKRLHRIYRAAGLTIRRKKRKHCIRTGQPLVQRTAVNQEWALDFVHDAVESGRAIRVLAVVDAYTRECLALQVDTSFASRRVTRVLGDLASKHPVDIRHYVIEPLFHPGTYNTDLSQVKARYCTYPNTYGPNGLFDGYTDVDRQTELTDEDGSLTGLVTTISVNKDPFFAAPVETVECASDITANMPPLGKKCTLGEEFCGTAKTSPYDYVSTVVYPDCGLNCPTLPPNTPDYQHWWANSCANPRCIGVPLYRQDINPNEQGGPHPFIRMAGQGVAQRSTLTVNHGSYYMDTTVSEAKQKMWPPTGGPPLLNVFKAKDETINSTGTYYLFLLFATKDTKQTYTLYVGPGFNKATDVYAVQVDVASSPFVPTQPGKVAWPWSPPDYKDGMLTVTMDMSFADFQTNYTTASQNKCQPKSFCSSNGSSCGCALDPANKLYPQCQEICSKWTPKDVDCPSGGCYGFAFHLPDTFVANDQAVPPAPTCYPDNSDWNNGFTPPEQNVAGSQCYYSPVPKGAFCQTTQ
jgi:hypothetical protein